MIRVSIPDLRRRRVTACSISTTDIGRGRPLEQFSELFGRFLVFVYHCFDRIVINGYLLGLTRPENAVYFFRDVLGHRAITKEVLRQRTTEYARWVEAFARNHHIPVEWAGKGVRKEEYVRPWLRRMERAKRYGVYFIFKSMEQGPTFRSILPKFRTADPDYRILRPHRSRFTYYYFYLRDHILGPMVVRVASFVPFHTTYYLNGHSFIAQELTRAGIAFRRDDNAFLAVADVQALQTTADRLSPQIIRQRLDHWTLVLGPKFSRRERQAMYLRRSYFLQQVEYCRNFIFQRRFPIHALFERGCELGLAHLTAQQISDLFGLRRTKRLKGKLHATLEQLEQGHHVLRIYCKNAFLRQYEKFRTFLRNELCANNVADFQLKKGLEHLGVVREKFLAITDRFATVQAQWLNVHVDFPMLQHLARPIRIGAAKVPGIKIHDTRMIRLMEVLLEGATFVTGRRATELHHAVVIRFQLPLEQYGLNQLRYDLRKLRAHGLLERDGHRYAYRLTDKGLRVALLFLLFHQRLCGPLAHSMFHHRPDPKRQPNSPLEAAYHKADAAIEDIIRLLKAA